MYPYPRFLLKSKLHRARITEANLDYVGSITIDADLCDAANLWQNEKVLVSAVTSGARLETYVMVGKRGSGEICLNGSAAHLIRPGEEVIIMAFAMSSEPIPAHVVFVGPDNTIIETKLTETPD